MTRLDYADGELRLAGAGITDLKLQDLKTRLEPQGYALRMDGDSLLIHIAPALPMVPTTEAKP